MLIKLLTYTMKKPRLSVIVAVHTSHTFPSSSASFKGRSFEILRMIVAQGVI